MSPTSRYIGSVACSRDLRVISRSRGGHLEKLTVDQSLFPDTCVTHFVCSLVTVDLRNTIGIPLLSWNAYPVPPANPIFPKCFKRPILVVYPRTQLQLWAPRSRGYPNQPRNPPRVLRDSLMRRTPFLGTLGRALMLPFLLVRPLSSRLRLSKPAVFTRLRVSPMTRLPTM
jgi:hypothetical protein